MTTPVGRSQAPTPTPPGRDATHAGVASGGGATEEALQQPNFEADDDSSGEQVEPPHHDEDEEIVWSNDEDRAIDQAEAYMLQHFWGQEALVLRSLEFTDDQRMGEASELIPGCPRDRRLEEKVVVRRLTRRLTTFSTSA